MISSADWTCSRPVRPASIAVVRQHRPTSRACSVAETARPSGVQSEATWRSKAKLRLCATSWAVIPWLFEV